MHKIDPVDELADLRAEISRLELRAAKLRAVILAAPEAAIGRWFRAEVSSSHRMVLDEASLPPTVRDNPAFWRERVTQVVKCVPIAAEPVARPGWPIRREAGAGAGLH